MIINIKPKAKKYAWKNKGQQRAAATSKLEETSKADEGWLLLEASESELLPANLAVSLQ